MSGERTPVGPGREKGRAGPGRARGRHLRAGRIEPGRQDSRRCAESAPPGCARWTWWAGAGPPAAGMSGARATSTSPGALGNVDAPGRKPTSGRRAGGAWADVRAAGVSGTRERPGLVRVANIPVSLAHNGTSSGSWGGADTWVRQGADHRRQLRTPAGDRADAVARRKLRWQRVSRETASGLPGDSASVGPRERRARRPGSTSICWWNVPAGGDLGGTDAVDSGPVGSAAPRVQCRGHTGTNGRRGPVEERPACVREHALSASRPVSKPTGESTALLINRTGLDPHPAPAAATTSWHPARGVPGARQAYKPEAND